MSDTSNTRQCTNLRVHADHGFIDCLPAGSVPAELGPAGKNRMRRVYIAPHAPDQPPVLGPASSFSEYVDRQPRHIRDLVKDIDKSEETTEQLAAMASQCERLHAGTDGGLMKDAGTFGFVWSDGKSIYASGKGHTTGGGDGMSSTRAELSGSSQR